MIVVSRYDSGKVNAELNGPLLSILPILQWATFGAMVFLPVLLIVRNVVFLNAEGATAIVLNVLACIALVLVALPWCSHCCTSWLRITKERTATPRARL